MGLANSQPKKPHSSSQGGSGKCPAEIAAQRAALLFGCYRRNDANDPLTFTAAVTAVLAQFPREVVEHVTDPVSGIASQIQWLPSIAEIRKACDERQAHLDRLADFDRRFGGRRPIYSLIENHAPGRRANVFVDANAPQYPRVYAWTQSDKANPLDWKCDEQGRADVWISLAVYDRIIAGSIGPSATEMAAEASAKLLADEWASIGESAPTISGTPVSRELVETMREAAE